MGFVGVDGAVPPAATGPLTGPVSLDFFTVDQVNAARDSLPPPQPKPAHAPLWQLSARFGYQPANGPLIVVPAHAGNVAISGNATDLASVPPFLWGILAPYGRQLRPALLHDHLCDQARATAAAGTPAARAQAYGERKAADDLFRAALDGEGLRLVRRWIFWAGVSFGRFLDYRKAWAIVLAVLVGVGALVQVHALAVLVGGAPPWSTHWLTHRSFWITLVVTGVVLGLLKWRAYAAVVLVGALAVALCSAGTAGPGNHGLRPLTWQWIVLAAVAAAVLLVGIATDWRVGIIALLIAPTVIVVILATSAAELLIALPDRIAWRVQGGNGPGPGPQPTMLRWRF